MDQSSKSKALNHAKLEESILLILHENMRGITMAQNLESFREKIDELSYTKKKNFGIEKKAP